MKIAKIMLMAIAVSAVVGAALAFKATKFVKLPYGICDFSRKLCSLNTIGLFATTTVVGGVITQVAPPTQPCDASLTCTTRITNWP